MLCKWLETRTSEVADALFYRLWKSGNAYRRWQMIYCESQLGVRGGIAVIPSDDATPDGWLPVHGIFADGVAHLTKHQMAYRIKQAARNLPVLDPNEEYIT